MSYRQIVRFCDVTAYSIDDASGRSVFRIHLTKKNRLRPGASIGNNYVFPGYKVDAYFDSQTLRMTQFKFGIHRQSLRWKTYQHVEQYDYELVDGKPILKRFKRIRAFNGKIKERDNFRLINQ